MRIIVRLPEQGISSQFRTDVQISQHRYDGKLSRTVLRGLEGSNALRLPDPAHLRHTSELSDSFD
jgi:hypothetical protein